MVLELLAQSTYTEQGINFSHIKNNSMESEIIEIHPPNVLDLSEDTEYAFQAALWGIEVRTIPCIFVRTESMWLNNIKILTFLFGFRAFQT